MNDIPFPAWPSEGYFIPKPVYSHEISSVATSRLLIVIFPGGSKSYFVDFRKKALNKKKHLLWRSGIPHSQIIAFLPWPVCLGGMVRKDADLFVVFRVFDPHGNEVVFQGALDPHTPIGQGWLRASHRKLDPVLSTEYRPYHTHDVRESLIPGKVYELDVEIWPTCIVVPVGYRIALTVRGKDYEHPGKGMRIKSFVNEMRGCGPFLHNDPDDRPEALFGGRNTLFAGGRNPSFVFVPIIPKRNV